LLSAGGDNIWFPYKDDAHVEWRTGIEFVVGVRARECPHESPGRSAQGRRHIAEPGVEPLKPLVARFREAICEVLRLVALRETV
jgi:hypothetical protein